MANDFQFVDAVRGASGALIGFMGPTNSGKTVTGLRLATGWVDVRGGFVVGICTESGRMLHHAPLPGRPAHPPDTFNFKYLRLDPPYTAERYASAISQAAKLGASAILVDQISYEHGGPGGMLDRHEKEVQRKVSKMKGRDPEWKKRERVSGFAWGPPKAARRALNDEIIRVSGDQLVIVNFRAEEKLDWKNKDEKNAPRPLGYQPTSNSRLVFEMLAMGLLLPGSNGTPEWNPQAPGEKALVKLPGFAKEFFAGQVTEETGRALARWALGDTKPSEPQPLPPIVGQLRSAIDRSELNEYEDTVQSNWDTYDERTKRALDEAGREAHARIDTAEPQPAIDPDASPEGQDTP